MIKEFIRSRVASKVMQNAANISRRDKERESREKARRIEKRPHLIYFFHCLKDPYSYIALRRIPEIKSKYSVDLEIIIVGNPPDITLPEDKMYWEYSLIDARRISPFYGIESLNQSFPPQEKINQGLLTLMNSDKDNILKEALKIGDFLWKPERKDIDIKEFPSKEEKRDITRFLDAGNKKRKKVGHYLGGVFNYEGENYWGLDRLLHLEERLTAMKLDKNDSCKVSQRKVINPKSFHHDDEIILEFYPSLNSPYTYISFERVKSLCESYCLKVDVKPVLPMLMRNMKIPAYKARYILSDAAREGYINGTLIDKCFTPLGRPAERAYSLFNYVNQHGKGFDYMNSLMICSFKEGKNIYKKRILKKIIQNIGLSWEEALDHLDSDEWKKTLEENRQSMYKGHVWGVPGFRLVSESGLDYSVWGQDRFWLIKNAIIQHIEGNDGSKRNL
tara:strand:- start:14218 stop:15558 length:1341 start_codon:yes stop_codon:yes gene_type:complete